MVKNSTISICISWRVNPAEKTIGSIEQKSQLSHNAPTGRISLPHIQSYTHFPPKKEKNGTGKLFHAMTMHPEKKKQKKRHNTHQVHILSTDRWFRRFEAREHTFLVVKKKFVLKKGWRRCKMIQRCSRSWIFFLPLSLFLLMCTLNDELVQQTVVVLE